MLRRVLRLLASVAFILGALWVMRFFLLNFLLYLPSRSLTAPESFGLQPEEVEFETEDGERLHAWWFRAKGDAIGHVLLCHGNAGNIGDRLFHALYLTDAGLDVFVFDYRGYGRSTGSPEEEGTYRDARAARKALLERDGVDPDRILYLGESLGGAVALALAVEAPPRGLVLVSTFTSVRDMARTHYFLIPTAFVPDAYPNLRRIQKLQCPLLVMHGDRDQIVPLEQGKTLFEAAPEPKRFHLFRGLGHNDLLLVAGRELGETIAEWAGGLGEPDTAG
jgi:fermentation-respiration switch protein FrsA (DUF1100 family)